MYGTVPIEWRKLSDRTIDDRFLQIHFPLRIENHAGPLQTDYKKNNWPRKMKLGNLSSASSLQVGSMELQCLFRMKSVIERWQMTRSWCVLTDNP